MIEPDDGDRLFDDVDELTAEADALSAWADLVKATAVRLLIGTSVIAVEEEARGKAVRHDGRDHQVSSASRGRSIAPEMLRSALPLPTAVERALWLPEVADDEVKSVRSSKSIDGRSREARVLESALHKLTAVMDELRCALAATIKAGSSGRCGMPFSPPSGRR
jgi:hypothetical protein